MGKLKQLLKLILMVWFIQMSFYMNKNIVHYTWYKETCMMAYSLIWNKFEKLPIILKMQIKTHLSPTRYLQKKINLEVKVLQAKVDT